MANETERGPTVDFADTIAVITGAGGGIGRATAWMLAARGATVVATDRRASAVEAVAATLGDDAEAETLDVTDGAAFQALVSSVVARHGRIDVLVNNAGVTGTPTPLHELDEATFDTLFDVNVKGAFYGMRAVLPHMIERGAGSIVNLSSVSAVHTVPNLTVYGASKQAVVGLTRGAAAEGAAAGVRVNAVCPGPTATPMVEGRRRSGDPPAQAGAEFARQVALGRLSTPEEQAELICFLASHRSGFITGEVVLADGGMTLGR